MSNDTELLEMQITDTGLRCVAALQEVMAQFDLSGPDAAMVSGELFAWAHILGFMPVGKERMMAQMERSCVSAMTWADSNFDGFKARAAIVAAFERGESGGRIQ